MSIMPRTLARLTGRPGSRRFDERCAGDGRGQRVDFASRARARKWRSRACRRVAHARQGRRSGASSDPQRDRPERAAQRQRHHGSRIAGARGGARRLEHAAADESGWNAAPALRSPSEEMRVIERVLAVEPRHLFALLQKATLLESQGKQRAAAKVYHHALQTIPPGTTRSRRAARTDRKGRRGHPGERRRARMLT